VASAQAENCVLFDEALLYADGIKGQFWYADPALAERTARTDSNRIINDTPAAAIHPWTAHAPGSGHGTREGMTAAAGTARAGRPGTWGRARTTGYPRSTPPGPARAAASPGRARAQAKPRPVRCPRRQRVPAAILAPVRVGVVPQPRSGRRSAGSSRPARPAGARSA